MELQCWAHASASNRLPDDAICVWQMSRAHRPILKWMQNNKGPIDTQNLCEQYDGIYIGGINSMARADRRGRLLQIEWSE